jgi:iron complex outermembrane receptor protein
MDKKFLLLAGCSAAVMIIAASPTSARAATDDATAQATIPANGAGEPVKADAAEAATQGDADIVVTAQRRAERLVDVPVSVSVVTGEMIAKSNTTGLFDLTSMTPGIVINRTGGYLQPTIRGIGTGVTGSTSEANVSLYLDGVYQPSQTANFFDLANVDGVEILKGPQGTLFGRNSTGGAILVRTSDPSFDTGGSIRVGYGRYNDIRTGVYFTTGLSETLAFNVSAYHRQSDGFTRDLRTGDNRGQNRSSDIRMKLLLQASDTVKFVLTGDYNDTSDPSGLLSEVLNGNAQGRLFPDSTPIATQRGQLSQTIIPMINSKVSSVTLNADVDFGFAKLHSISNYRHENTVIVSDNDSTYALVNQAAYKQPVQNLSQEVTLASPSDQKFVWLAGLYYYHARQQTPQYLINNTPFYVSRNKTDAYAAFADGTIQFNNLYVILGGRYSSEKRSVSAGAVANPYSVNQTATFNSFTPRLGLRYALAPRTNIYATYSRGFKAGLFNTTTTAQPPVRPEYVDAFEVGFKSAGHMLDLNLSAYYYNYKDIQVTAFDFSTSIQRLFNAAKARIYGLDADATVRVSPAFDIRAAFAYTHARYRNFPGAIIFVPRPGGLTGNLTVTGYNASGNTMLRAPEITISSTANYRVQAGSSQIEFSVTPYYTSKINYTFDERIQQPGYFTVDGAITFVPKESVRLSVWGRNLTNKTYATLLNATSTRDVILYAQPRTYGVSLSYRF